nr:MAG TPA: hypothetical protein [Caudoviricetes sp.]
MFFEVTSFTIVLSVFLSESISFKLTNSTGEGLCP